MADGPHTPLPALPADVAVARRLAQLMDNAVRIPVIGVRVGLDALVGLVPGAGDAAGALVGVYTVVVALRHRVPLPVVSRMVLNLATDALAGAVPVVGDVLDVAVRAHARNAALLEQHRDATAAPRRLPAVARVAVGALAALLAALAGLAGGAAWALWQLLLPGG